MNSEFDLDDKIISTSSGPVRGIRIAGITGYRGIPFAAPPAGDLRWKPPLLPKPWKKPREMAKYGPACPQSSLSAATDIGEMSEDCLYLNVWTPAKREAEKLPVMMFLHGGGFARGSGTTPLCNEPYLAQKGVVLVTVNYRLGGFGFLAHPGLTAESARGASGNYGLQDQAMALRWIRDNISRFGGDPGNVTVFGHSAGAASIAALMSSPLAAGLFHRAIIQSSGYFPPYLRKLREENHGLESMESIGLRFAEALGVKDADDPVKAMRAKPWQEIITAWEQAALKRVSGIGLYGIWMMNHMIIDGHFLQDSPGNIFNLGKQQNIPLMTGATSDEGSILPYLMNISTAERYRTYVERALGEVAGRALELYPAGDDAQAKKMIRELFGSTFSCGTRSLAEKMVRVQPKTYLYKFTYPPRLFLFLFPGMKNLKDWVNEFGCYHGCELPYIFGYMPGNKFSAADREFSGRLMDYWVNFARSGGPNNGGSAHWPAYTACDKDYLVLDSAFSTGRQFDLRAWEFYQELEAKH